MSKKSWISILFTLSLTLCFSGLTFGQETTGSIVGSVKDSAGAGVPNATVTITDPSKDNLVVRTVQTNEDGIFSVPNVAVTVYIVTVEAPNFKKSVNTDVKVDVGQRRSVDVTLEAGNIAEIVTVTADQVAVETSTPTASTTINGDQVRELSLNNRNWVQLVTLAPGVSNDLNDSISVGTTDPQTGAVNIVGISVNGARSSQNTFTVDGADITDRGSNLTIQAYPSVDSIGEFRVLRSLYPAESGRSGGGQINVVTRSGADRFHGGAYEFVRNEKFNANSPSLNSLTVVPATLGREDNGKVKRQPFRYNNYGWNLSGPVYFLKFGERDPDDSYFGRWSKTFFFFSQEFRKDIRFPIFTTTVPTALQRNAQFTAPICIQASGTTCTASITGSPTTPVTLTGINPISQQYVNSIYNNLPLPNSGVNQLIAGFRNVADFQQEIIKIDHSFDERFSINYRYQRDEIPTIDANALFSSGSGLPGVSTTSSNSPGRTHTAQGIYTASQNVIFEGRYNFGYGAILSENIGLLARNRTPISVPLPFPVTRDRIPSISGNGFTALTGYGPYDNFSWKSNVSGNLTWIIGNHTTKYGVVWSKYRKNENNLSGSNEATFSAFRVPGGTSDTIIVPDPDGPGPLPGGNLTQQLWANFLIGTNSTLSQSAFDYTADLRQEAFEAYAQDEWKFRPNITLYAGVRYSFFGSPYDRNGRLSNFYPELWSRTNAPLVEGDGDRVAGTGNYCNGLIVNTNGSAPFPNCTPTQSPFGKYVVDVPKNDFAPRIGLAWDPFNDGKTAIRTGYGIYHEQVLNATFLNIIIQNPPFQQNCVVSGVSISNAPTNCTVQAANLVSNLRAVQPEWETPYMQHWSLDVQRQLTSKTLVTAGYFGSKGTNLIGGFELNLLRPGQAQNSLCAPIGNTTTPTVPCQQPNQAFFITTGTGGEQILDQIRPYRGYRSITMISPRYNSNYHSLQVSGQQRFSGASQVNVAYTWSKNITDNPNDRSAAPQNSYDIGSEKARAALDRRHIFTVNWIYELPFFSAQRGLVGKVLGGWQASGIATFQTGLGLTPTVSGYDPAGLGLIPPPLTVARANATCNPNEGGAQTVQQWFNTSCFQIVPVNNNVQNPPIIGDASRGLIEGPGTRRVDFTLTKNLRFGERFRVQLRGEAFNVFNWTNPRGLSTVAWNTLTAPISAGGTCNPNTQTCSTFGQVVSYRDPRVMQFGIKFNF